MSNEREFRRLYKILEEQGTSLRDRVEAVVEINAQEAASEAKRLAPKFDGILQKGIRVVAEPELNSDRVISRSVISEADHSPYVEFGTRTRFKAPPEWTAFASQFKGRTGVLGISAYERIKRWGLAKGFDMNGIRNLYFNIMRYGIHPQPFMYPAFKKQTRKLAQDLRKLLG